MNVVPPEPGPPLPPLPEPIRRFVLSDAPRIRCVAGPGTGKTTGLKRRVERLLTNGVAGDRIFAVTFTRQAAAQLKSELTALGVPGAEAICASTLHAYAFTLLGGERAIEALGRWPRPCLEYELAPLFHDLESPLGSVSTAKKQLQAFDAMWARLQTDEPGWPTTPADREFQRHYVAWMTYHRAIHIGELVPLVIQYLRQNPQPGDQGPFDHSLVDEFQDLNRADQELITLTGRTGHIAIVGDDDQSIYAFRHAHPEGIRSWLGAQPDPKDDVELANCHRCGGNILALANHLIRQNPGRLRGDLRPVVGREQAGGVSIVQWQSREQETRGIARGVLHLVDPGRMPNTEKLIVLVPRHEFGRVLRDELSQQGLVDVKLHTKMDWEDPTLGRNLSLLRLLSDPEDRVALRYWLGQGHNQWRRNEYRRLRDWAQEQGLTLDAILEDENACRRLRIQPLRERWVELRGAVEALQGLEEEDLLDRLLPLEGSTKDLGASIRTLRQQGAEGTVCELLIQAIVSPEENPLEAKVSIMTYQGAKGLTAHTVVVTGLVNGVMPKHYRPIGAEQEADLQEQRRLVFVALTRAKECAVLSSFRNVTRAENAQLRLGLEGRGFRLRTQASRFLNEMGPTTPDAVDGEAWLRGLVAY